MLGMLNDCFMEALVRKKRKKLPIMSWLEARCGSRAEIKEQLCITHADKNNVRHPYLHILAKSAVARYYKM